MNNFPVVRMEQPRGPVFPTDIRANLQLAHRLAKAHGISISDLEGRVSHELAERFGSLPIPTQRTVRNWQTDSPCFPELMINLGAIAESDILPSLRPFLNKGSRRDAFMSHRSAYGYSYGGSARRQEQGSVGRQSHFSNKAGESNGGVAGKVLLGIVALWLLSRKPAGRSPAAPVGQNVIEQRNYIQDSSRFRRRRRF